MGICLSRSRDDYLPVFPNELQNEFHEGGNSMKSCEDLDFLKQAMDDSSSAENEVSKNELNSPVPEKFPLKLGNPDGQKMSQNGPGLICKREGKENRIFKLFKSVEENMKSHDKLKTRSKNSSSCSADFIWDLTLDIDISKNVSRSCSEKELFSQGSFNNCTEMHHTSVDCENVKGQTGEKDADFDEISFGHKTGEILDFFREYSCNRTAESPHSRPKLQIYSILDMKKLKSIRLSQFSKSSRFGSSNSETESPRSKLIGLLMKNLSSRSRSKCSADKNVSDIKSACECNDKNETQKESLQEHQKHKAGRRRQCLLSMFNVDRSFSIEGNTETLIVADHNDTRTGDLNSLMDGSRVDFRIPVKTLSNEFVMFNFCPNEGGGDSTNLHETTAEVSDVGFRSVHQLQGVCRLSRLSVTGEEAAFGSPFSIGRGRRSKGPELSEDLILGRFSDAFSDSSSDLFELEFLGHQMNF